MSCPFSTGEHETSLHALSIKLTGASLINLSLFSGGSIACAARVCFSDLELDLGATMVSDVEQEQRLHSACLEDELGTARSIQRMLLKLHYHDSLIGLLRSFIPFSSNFLKPVRSPWMDKHATDAILHALALCFRTRSITTQARHAGICQRPSSSST